MTASANKTQKTKVNPFDFIDTVADENRRHDCLAIIAMMQEVTGAPPRMWGPAIIGFGDYHYKYESGREGDFFLLGFSPRKQHLVLYIMPGCEAFPDEMKKLGKHKTGKSCLYINRLADIDRTILRQIMMKSVMKMKK